MKMNVENNLEVMDRESLENEIKHLRKRNRIYEYLLGSTALILSIIGILAFMPYLEYMGGAY